MINPNNVPKRRRGEDQVDAQGMRWDVESNSEDSDVTPESAQWSMEEQVEVSSQRSENAEGESIDSSSEDDNVAKGFNPQRASTQRRVVASDEEFRNKLRDDIRADLADEMIAAKDAMVRRARALEKSTKPVGASENRSRVGGGLLGDQTMTSSYGGKVREIREFHKGLQTSKQLTEWHDWHDLIEMALNTADVRDQMKRANHLTMAVGDEVRMIIKTRKLFQKRDDPSFPVYDELVKGLEKYFREISDPLVENLQLRRMKQKPRESPRDWYGRVMEAAARVGGEQEENVRTTWCDGLHDEVIKKEVFTNKLTIEEAVMLATRHFALNEMKLKSNETEGQVHQAFIGTKTDDATSLTTAEIHAIKKELANKPRQAGTSRDGGQGPQSQTSSGWRRPQAAWPRDRPGRSGVRGDQGCSYCGFGHGRDERCPATNVECRACGKFGHFARKCRAYPQSYQARPQSYQARPQSYQQHRRRDSEDTSGPNRDIKEVHEIVEDKVKLDAD